MDGFRIKKAWRESRKIALRNKIALIARPDVSQTQTPGRKSASQKHGSEPQSLEDYVQELVSGELAQSLFTLTQKIHKKLPEHLGGGGDEEERCGH